jgi:hypothetical protein
MASEERKARRVDVGFAGGQVLALRMVDEPYEALRTALRDDSAARWHVVETEDSDVTLDLSQVVYVRLDTEQHKVGF